MCIWIPLSAPVNDGQHTWLELWATRICTVLGLVLFINAFIAIFWPWCIPPALMQMVASVIIISIEGPTFVEFLAFAAPVSRFFDDKSPWTKVIVYATLTMLPFIIGLSITCFSIAFIVGFLNSLAVTLIYIFLIRSASTGRANNVEAYGGGPPPVVSPTAQSFPASAPTTNTT
ncbi:unnamed protein product [Medioppia subpectinata]|uniref:Calcium channel flower n=1 Tax=Medioppia subpectinata TaxID=1979941 RepID=A0A7R9PZP8_9ACAR|nr:unnamed protein product [Medioppia subpectinata]CAG2106670.1 unnamed protein product [Medioppia subpectinata]